MGIVDDVKGILSVKIKPRQDSYSDQFSRIFLLKLMFVAAFFTGMDWYNDSLKCINPFGLDGGFMGSSCWINGFYVYENIRYHEDEFGYYGLPRDISHDGIRPNGELCSVYTTKQYEKKKVTSRDATCTPMTKTFFLQYQYFTFFLVMMGALYYAPYSFFKYVNTDKESLKKTVKGNGDAKKIVATFFSYDLNPKTKLNYRILGSVVTKLLYVIVNILAFVFTDNVLHGNFQSYGTQYAKWAKLDNSIAYDYMGGRHSPKPGDVLLPSFAFCEIAELAKDVKDQLTNKHLLVCELSQHILYQYVLIVVWWAMVIGIIVSVVGLIMLFIDYVMTMASIKNKVPTHSSAGLTLRECEYLEYIYRKNIPLFSELLHELKAQRTPGLLHAKAPPYNSKEEENEF